MTRQERILEAGQEITSNPIELEGFIEGAEWADNNPNLYVVTRRAIARERQYVLQKATEWLEKFAYNSVITDNIGEREKQAIIIAFKEFMEEQ